ncbi:UBA-like [Acididesulfobacillus acetoxydans]|uniref:UBA-like n=1 Tax=Acididesulfobacillus acetoxydans TaxID=1561005 RepID=A0A8S0Y4Z3_9FIRM|nr:DUF4342 domain-containing protein [Acididesulfobacillus acetoxydans]CAA7603465.1 UBA-like [Acididesulfobacillus acetoxydans]CEJ06832.1 UBA-like [Acididesulfobacillus acetoxydans]
MSEKLWTELEKIDILRERMGLNYEQARTALAEAGGDVVKALALVERGENNVTEDMERDNGEMWTGLKHKFKQLRQARLNVKHDEKTVFSVSAPVGLLLAYGVLRRPGLRMLGVAGLAVAAFRHYSLEMDPAGEQRREGSDDWERAELRV